MTEPLEWEAKPVWRLLHKANVQATQEERDAWNKRKLDAYVAADFLRDRARQHQLYPDKYPLARQELDAVQTILDWINELPGLYP